MRAPTGQALGPAVWLAAALVAGAMALAWSLPPGGAAAQSSRYEIQGIVSGPGGEPLEGISVEARGEFGEDTFGPWTALPTNAEGQFAIAVPEGMFRLRLSLEFEGSGGCFLGYFGSDSARAPYGDVALVVVTGGDVEGLDITLSGVPSELCHRVEGVVVDADGEPVARRQVSFREWGELASRNEWTDATGRFRLHLWEGTYLIEVSTDRGAECTVEGYEGAEPERRARIDVHGGVSGLRIMLSTGAYTSPTSPGCFFPPRMATTTLRPGWNLAGWTAEETDARALFEAIPALEAAYAWDAGTQSFTRARRDDLAGERELTAITPGMGLWLRLGGDDPVTWTRPVTPAGGFVSLRPGWNLVAWAGREGTAPADAFAFLRKDFVGALGWEVTAGEFLRHYPTARPEVNTLRRLELGEGLWINVRVARRWLQPGATAATVEFVGEVAAERRAGIGPRVDDVLAFFGERTGIIVPGVRFVVGEVPVCADYGHGFRTVRLHTGCVGAVAHEYVHAVQFMAGSGHNARWLVEGVAERWSDQYYESRSDTYDAHSLDRATRGARFVQVPLDELESHAGFQAQGVGAYGLARLAADWLASVAGGDDALFGYFDARTNEEDWQVTFEREFGMGVDDFYASFVTHRADVAPTHPKLMGAVLTPDGAPLVGATVHVRNVAGGWFRTVATGHSGTFDLVLESGVYDLWLTVDGCPLPWSSSGLPGEAVTARKWRLALAEGALADIVITPSATAADTCQWRWIRGIVTDLVGNPRGGVIVRPSAWVDGDMILTAIPRHWTTGDGVFSVRVPEGRYGLSVRVGSVTGYYEGTRGVTLHRPDAAQIVVGASDVSDLVIQFGVIGGVIRGPNADLDLRVGLQQGSRTVYTKATPEIQFIAPRGTFLMAVYCSDFSLVGWYGGDSGLVTDRSQAAPIVMDETDIAVTLDVPADVTCQ